MSTLYIVRLALYFNLVLETKLIPSIEPQFFLVSDELQNKSFRGHQIQDLEGKYILEDIIEVIST